MKKYLFLALILLMVSSCGVGTFVPYANNNYGIQTQVVLDRANYRIVDNVEVVVEVNNSNLKRRDVEKSAFAELVNRYKLTGSQAFINVFVEEIDRQNSSLFNMIFGGGLVDHKQHVAARATIIEFLQENGEPIASIPSTHSNRINSNAVSSNPATVVPQPEPAKGRVEQTQAMEVPQDAPIRAISKEPLADAELAQKVLDQAERTITRMRSPGNDDYHEYEKIFKELYSRTLHEPTVTAIDNLNATTILVASLYGGSTSSVEIKNAYKKEKNIDRRIEILVEYAKKYIQKL